jgi:hypothetical protein
MSITHDGHPETLASPLGEITTEAMKSMVELRLQALGLLDAAFSGETFGDIKVESGFTDPDETKKTANFTSGAKTDSSLVAITHNLSTNEVFLLGRGIVQEESRWDQHLAETRARLAPAIAELIAGKRVWRSEDIQGWDGLSR